MPWRKEEEEDALAIFNPSFKSASPGEEKQGIRKRFSVEKFNKRKPQVEGRVTRLSGRMFMSHLLIKRYFIKKVLYKLLKEANYSFESQSQFLTHNFLGTHILSHRREEKQTGKNSLSSSSSPYLIICVLHYRNTWEDKIKRTSEKREDQTKRSRRFYLSSHFD